MKEKAILAGLMLIAATALSACAAETPAAQGDVGGGETAEQTDTGVVRQTFVDESQDGQLVEVVAGALVTVKLESNATTGFRWELAEPIDEGMLALIESKYIAPEDVNTDEETVGAGGVEEWTFETLKPGETTISMAYSRPWEGGEKGVETFSFTVRSLSGRLP